jgi:hypothetical protein
LLKVHDAFLTKLLPGAAWSRIFAIGFTAPALITISLTLVLSPAILPRPQIAYSTTSKLGELNRSTKTETVSFSKRTCTCSDDPEAKFVKHQAASN